MNRVTVITPALPTRTRMLEECLQSVAAQETQPCEHLVALDYSREGPSAVRNRLATVAQGDWLAFLDDDDLLLPNHLRLLLEGAASGADLVYSFCSVKGRVEMPEWLPNATFDAGRLRAMNFIPVTCLVRKSAFHAAGGFHHGDDQEDWRLWLRLLDRGAEFKCVPAVTWVYRFHGGNRTYQEITHFNPYAPFELITLQHGDTPESLASRYPDHLICFDSQNDVDRFRQTGTVAVGAKLRLVRKTDGHAY